MAELSFDASGVPERNPFEPIPPGWYTAEIVGWEMLWTKAGNGRYINFQWRVLGPEHAGHTVFDIVMIEHPNEKVVEIGRQQLAAVARSTGVTRFRDTEALHGIPVEVKLAVEKSDEYGDKNRIKAVRARGVNGDRPVSTRPPAAQQMPAGAATDPLDDIPF